MRATVVKVGLKRWGNSTPFTFLLSSQAPAPMPISLPLPSNGIARTFFIFLGGVNPDGLPLPFSFPPLPLLISVPLEVGPPKTQLGGLGEH